VHSTRLNQHYGPALRVAEWILESVSWAHRRGKAEAGTFLVNIAALYERFVADVFRSTLAPVGISVESQLTSWTLDREGQIKLRPDLVLAATGRILTVADTKYKVWGQAGSSPPNADVYQALAYALRADVDTSHLLYVSGDVVPRTYTIDSAGVRVVAHAIDISGSPAELLDRTTEATRLIATYPSEAKADVA
jgi:5-methylcytosine-specific restriction enzyme subunit McrC